MSTHDVETFAQSIAWAGLEGWEHEKARRLARYLLAEFKRKGLDRRARPVIKSTRKKAPAR